MPKKYLIENKELMKEWDWEKNKDLDPNLLSVASDTKTWWKCSKCGFTWQTAINKRTYRKHGCLNCSGQVAFPGHNDLETLYPEIAKEWHPIKNIPLLPSNVRPKSNKKYWWKCSKCGYDWQASGNNRIGHKSGCPACSGRVPKTGINDLFTIFPNLKEEWDFEKNNHLDPSCLGRGSHAIAWWKCPKGHVYEMAIKSKATGANCPYCSSHRVLSGFNDFATSFPKISKEWDFERNNGKSPTQYTAHSNQKVWWICPKGHKYEMSIEHRSNGGNCPYCSNHKLLPNYNDLGTLYPELAKEWDYKKNGTLKPTDIIPKTKRKIWWKCSKCGFTWQTSAIDRVYGTGCPKCVPEKRSKTLRQKIKDKNLGIKDPFLLQQWNYEKNKNLLPQEYSTHSNKKVWWKCSKGHEYQATIDKKTSGQGCPICSNHKLLPGFNDLQTRFPTIAREWDYEKNKNYEPSRIVATSTKKAWWKCNICHTSWQSKIQSRTIRNSGCPKCSAKKRVEEHKKAFILKNGCITNPLLLGEWNYPKNHPLTPQDFTPASGKSVWWVCSKCGYEWQARISNRSILERGCPCCSNQVVVKGKNDLTTSHPKLAREWHPTKNKLLSPEKVSYGQNKKVWWICPIGHEYQATINHRTGKEGTGCPICNSGRQTSFAEQAFFFYIKNFYPDAISRYSAPFLGKMELDIFIPSIKKAIEYDGEAWHKVEKISREIRKYAICKKHKIYLIRLKEGNNNTQQNADFSFCVPDLYKKENLDTFIPKVLDRLENTHSFTLGTINPNFYDVNTKRDEQKILEMFRTNLKNNSFGKTNPELAKEWHPTKNGNLRPTMFKPHSGHKIWWLCPTCGNEYLTSIGHRTDGTGCPKCGIKKSTKTKQKAIYMIDPETNKILLEFESITEAGRQMKINHSNIGMVCKGIRPKAGGYKWRYKK